MSRDERLYPNPDVFRPERFLGKPPTEDRAFNPWNYTFGTGKRYQIDSPVYSRVVLTAPRKCPGVHLIQSSLWLVIARVVAALDIKPKAVNGVPMELNVKEKNAFFRWVARNTEPMNVTLIKSSPLTGSTRVSSVR